MSLRVLAIDPGERVGYATGTIADGAVLLQRDGRADGRPFAQIVAEDGPLPEAGVPYATRKLLTVDTHGIATLKDFALKLFEVAGSYDVIVYETWRLRPAMARKFVGSDFPTVQLIGMIRAAAWINGVKLAAQGPDTKATADRTLAAGQHPDIAARIAAAPKDHDEAHDTDALRHLWFYYWKGYV